MGWVIALCGIGTLLSALLIPSRPDDVLPRYQPSHAST